MSSTSSHPHFLPSGAEGAGGGEREKRDNIIYYGGGGGEREERYYLICEFLFIIGFPTYVIAKSYVLNIFSSTLSTFRGWGGGGGGRREERDNIIYYVNFYLFPMRNSIRSVIFIVRFSTYVIAKSYVLNIFSSTLSTFRGWKGGEREEEERKCFI